MESTTPPPNPPATEAVPPPPPPYAPPPPRQRAPHEKTPILAAILSVLPGLGNVYNGLYLRAVCFFVIWGGLMSLSVDAHGSEIPLLVLSTVFFWFFNIFDAYRQATLINYGYATDLGMSEARPKPKTSMASGMALGVVLIIIGFFGFLDHYFRLDLSYIADHWYVLVFGFGIWVVYQAARSNKTTAVDDLDGYGEDELD